MSYPICKNCGSEMNEFDGWAWYTCPYCGESVRIIDGEEAWQTDLFRDDPKKRDIDPEEWSDFEEGWRPDNPD